MGNTEVGVAHEVEHNNARAAAPPRLYRPMKDLGAEIYEFLSERRPEDAYRLLVSGGVQFVFQLLGSLQLSLFLLTLFDPLVRPRRHCGFPR